MSEPLKILPAVIFTCATLFALKAVGLWTDIRTEFVGLRPAYAAGASVTKPQEDHGQDSSHSDQSNDHHSGDSQSSAQEDTTSTHGTENEHETVGADKMDYDADDNSFSASSDLLPSSYMSAAEVDVLESLSERRKLLDKREREIEIREKLVLATESRVKLKVAELQSLEEHIQELLGQVDEAEQTQADSLVKVYEAMKAKDAARIFENLNQDILIRVASGMKEAKIAAIMSAMNPAKAQALTVLLANRMDLSNSAEIKALRDKDATGG